MKLTCPEHLSHAFIVFLSFQVEVLFYLPVVDIQFHIPPSIHTRIFYACVNYLALHLFLFKEIEDSHCYCHCIFNDRVGSEYNLLRDDQLLQVINAYLKPKCHSADSDAVHR